MTSLYIHIPFCKRKCNYCDFVSYAGKEGLIDEYVDALIRELEFLLSTFNFQLSTIYFGGGTPTLLEPRHFEKVISNFQFPISNSEITIEANPGTADKAKLKALRKLGINRISIGAQSFNDQHLKTLGRIHNSKDIFKFYHNARSAGFDNINLDMIFALPNQTLDEWKNDLQTAISLNPDHLSTYNLQVEEGTPFWEMANAPSPDTLKTLTLSQRERVLPFAHNFPQRVSFSLWEKGASLPTADEGFRLPDEETELAMYEFAIETLVSAGFNHYEISNFAKPGFECRHNINYWKNGNYIGIGGAAHSHVDGKRWANPDSIEGYIETWKREETAKFIRRFPSTTHDATDQRETLFMGLRLLKGLPHNKFQGFEKELAELIESDLLTKQNSHVTLTRKGLYLANEVFEKFV